MICMVSTHQRIFCIKISVLIVASFAQLLYDFANSLEYCIFSTNANYTEKLTRAIT